MLKPPISALTVQRLITHLLAVLALAAAPARSLGQSPRPATPAVSAPGAPAAELRSVSGVVFAQSPGGEPRVLQTGARLLVGDTVGTNKGAFALIVFGDGSRVALRPESAIAINGFSFKPEDPGADQMSVQLLKGWLRKVSGQIGKRGNPGAFEMKVVDSTIGIRGTDFAVRYCDAECAAAPPADSEGVLPQSGQVGRLLSSDRPVLLERGGVEAPPVQAGETLRIGDVLSTREDTALVGLNDGTRLVLGPDSRVALRAEEDARGRRALRIDLKQGTLRLATAPGSGGRRLYGLLVDAGQLVGVRQDTALDLVCEGVAGPGDLACPAAAAVLRRGQAEVFGATGLRSLRTGVPERLAEPAGPPSSMIWPGAEPLTVVGLLELPGQGRDIGRAGAAGRHMAERPGAFQRVAWTAPPGPAPVERSPWLAQVGAPGLPGGMAQSPSRNLFDPLDLSADAARPASVGVAPAQGVFTAVFSGTIEVGNPLGRVLVTQGQGTFVGLQAVQAPVVLPAAPAFMERDAELQRGRLYPEQCPR